MEIHSKPLFNSSSSIQETGQNNATPQPQDIVQKGEATPTNAIMTDLVDILSENLGVDFANSMEQLDETDETSMGAVLTLPDNEALIEDLEKLISLLQMDMTEAQLKEAMERIENLKDQIAARCDRQLEEIQKSVEEMKKADAQKKRSKIFGWLAAIFAVVIFAALAVVTGGAAVPLLVCAGVGAALAVTSAVAQQFDLPEKLTKAISKSLVKNFDMSKKEADKVAQGILFGIQLGIAAASIAMCLINPGNLADSIRSSVAVIQAVGGLAQGLVAAAGTGNSIASTITNYNSQMTQIQLLQLQKMLERLQEMLENEEDGVQELIKMLQQSVIGLRNMIESEAEISNHINQNVGFMQI